MLIRIKQIRNLADGKPGTDVVLGKGANQRTLSFRPLDPKQPDRDHVCDVTDPQDIARLLAIPEGYEVHESELASRVREPAPAKAEETGDAAGAERAEQKSGNGKALAWYMAPDVDKEKLLAAVAEKTGRKPHPSTSIKKLQEMLAA